MFGEHDYDKALAIAKQKEAELGRKCIVVAGIEDPTKFTVAVSMNAETEAEYINRLRRQKL